MSNVVELRPTAAPCPGPVAQAETAAAYGGYEPFVDELVIGSFVGIAPRRVLEMAREGELPAHPIGRDRKTWRFRISEVNAYFTALTNQCRASIPAAVPVPKGRKRNG